MYYIGYDLGSSSVKAALIDTSTGTTLGIKNYPQEEMAILAPQEHWAEQDPELWWEAVTKVTRLLLESVNIDYLDIQGIGISYQMHGLVLVDRQMQLLRPSIIWCDSRAVATGVSIEEVAGKEKCMSRLLNAPGNFTLSKLQWVKDNEPAIFERIYKMMLPGDYIAYKLTGQCLTTPSGISEGIFWDFQEHAPAHWLLDSLGISREVVPEMKDSFSHQGTITAAAAKATGLPEGIPLLYRAGDQPNNALALNVLEPGQIAATGGTSGVVYAITANKESSESIRINNFAHVNHTANQPRIGKLLCINGCGIVYSWIREQVTPSLSYEEMNALAETAPIGSEGLSMLPFGNGAERMLSNANVGASIHGIHLNVHKQAHLLRAALEGIAFAFVYGLEILQNDGVPLKHIKAGNDNLFQSAIFSETLATLAQVNIDMVETTGAVGAARAAACTDGTFKNMTEAVQSDRILKTYTPSVDKHAYQTAYERWKTVLQQSI